MCITSRTDSPHMKSCDLSSVVSLGRFDLFAMTSVKSTVGDLMAELVLVQYGRYSPTSIFNQQSCFQ
jgi:hypothetical protein